MSIIPSTEKKIKKKKIGIHYSRINIKMKRIRNTGSQDCTYVPANYDIYFAVLDFINYLVHD